MTKMLDEIHEELKREDFLKKFFRFLAIAGVCAFFLLIGVAVSTWLDSRKEDALYEKEIAFLSSMKLLENPEASPQERKEAEEQIKAYSLEKDGIGMLSALYLFDKTKKSDNFSKDFLHLQTILQKNCEESPEMKSFFSAILAWNNLNALKKNKLPQKAKELENFYRKNISWKPMVFLYDAVATQCMFSTPEETQEKFSQWEKSIEKGSRFYWLFLYASIGAGVRRHLQKQDMTDGSMV